MKKTISFLLIFFASILVVNAEYYENNTMKINQNNWMNYAFSDTYKVDDSYVYTEFSDDSEGNVNENLTIIRTTLYGKEEWKQEITDVPHTYHNILVEDDNVLFISDIAGFKVLSAEDGSIKYEDTTLLGEDIKRINDNYIILASDKITIIDKNYKLKYELNITELTTLGTASLFVEYEVSDSNIYILAYDVDEESNRKPVIITTNLELKESKIVELTYDENQGFLSENNYFIDVKEFVKIGDYFYQVGFDVYKISLTGETEIVFNSEEKGIDCFDITEYNDSIFTIDAEWTENNGYARLVERDNNFNEINVYYPKKNNKSNSWASAKNITKDDNDLIVKWMEENNYKFYITEYSTEQKAYLNPAGTASCKVVSGTGYEIGNEVKCGTEYFYIVEANEDEVTMLAKYNLYVGNTYEKIIFDQTFTTRADAISYYNENYSSNYDGYQKILYRTNTETNTTEYYGVTTYKYIDYEEVKQDETAIGAHGDEKGTPEFPEIGVVDFNDWPNEDEYYESYEGGFIDFKLSSNTDSFYYLSEYADYLNSIGVNTYDVTNITISQLSNLIEIVGEEQLPLKEWYEDGWNAGGFHDYYILGSMIDYIPNKYNWIYSTTYWTNTCMPTVNNGEVCTSYAYFVDTLGNICYEYWCSEAIGAGIRPLVTIPISELEYKVLTKTDGNGTVKANTILAPSGELIEFTITPNEGYVLQEVKVTDAEGNVITFTDYTFTMPDADVLIEVTFVVDNPVTADIAICIAIILITVICFVIHRNKKKITWINK